MTRGQQVPIAAYGRQVRVYRNLHNGLWSIMDRQTSKVLEHGASVLLQGCTLVVRPGGRAQVRGEGKTNVHALL